MTIYVENESYNRAADAIAKLKPCPFAGSVTPDQVKIVLGEILDVWPESIAAVTQ